MKFGKELMKEVMWSSVGDEVDVDENSILEIADVGEWVSEGKYEYCWWVFKFEDKYYMLTNTRSGSYYSDYWYESDDWSEMIECDEVKRVEIKKYDWVTV